MTRYLKKCRIAGLAGLASLVVFAFGAAPAGATVTCPAGVTPPSPYCTTTIKLAVVISVVQTSNGPVIKIKITVKDPFVVAKLYRKSAGKYRLVKTVFKGDLNGTKRLKVHPKKKGKYELKVKASANGTSKTVKKFFAVR